MQSASTNIQWQVWMECVNRTLSAWLYCARCEVWWRRDNGMGLFFQGALTSTEGKSQCFSITRHFRQCYASNIVGTVWGRPCSIPAWLCPSAQSKVSEDMVGWVWCGRTWLACTEPGLQPQQTPLGWTRTEIVSQDFSSKISAWFHKCSTGLMDQIIPRETLWNLVKYLSRRVEAVTAAKGRPTPY